MTKLQTEILRAPAQDFSGGLTQNLISYLKTAESEETLSQVLNLAGETRSVAELSDTLTWSTYAQLRRLLEAASALLGGAAALSMVGKHFFDSIQIPEVVASHVTLGSTAAIYETFSSLIEMVAPRPPTASLGGRKPSERVAEFAGLGS